MGNGFDEGFANHSASKTVINDMRRLPVLALALFAACGGPYVGRLQGHVVDEQGRPVKGARITLSGPDHLVTDENGKFDGELTFHRRRWISVSALTEDHRLGGVASTRSPHQPVAITMQRLVRVSGRVNSDKLPPSIRDLHGEEGIRWPRVTVRKADPVVGQFQCIVDFKDRAFESFLNAGAYTIEVQGMHVTLAREFRVTADSGDIDLGVLEAIPLPGYDRFDSPAPELQVSDGTKLADLRGKWVLLLLWDRPCKNDLVIRKLVRFHNDPHVDRGGFAIVAVHRDPLSDSELERARTHDHEGRRPEPISFPISIDYQGRTFEAYGVPPGVNALHVINPEGKFEFTRWTEPVEHVREMLKK